MGRDEAGRDTKIYMVESSIYLRDNVEIFEKSDRKSSIVLERLEIYRSEDSRWEHRCRSSAEVPKARISKDLTYFTTVMGFDAFY